MTHWRTPSSEIRDLMLWRRGVMILCGFLLGGAVAVVVWGFS